jgi:hypothetical protein
MANDDGIDWSLTTFDGSRREQYRRWSQLPLEGILRAQEEMAALAHQLNPQAYADSMASWLKDGGLPRDKAVIEAFDRWIESLRAPPTRT